MLANLNQMSDCDINLSCSYTDPGGFLITNNKFITINFQS